MHQAKRQADGKHQLAPVTARRNRHARITCTQLQGRANYLALGRLAEEVEDALSEEVLPPARA